MNNNNIVHAIIITFNFFIRSPSWQWYRACFDQIFRWPIRSCCTLHTNRPSHINPLICERVKLFTPASILKESNSTPLKCGLLIFSHIPRKSMVERLRSQFGSPIWTRTVDSTNFRVVVHVLYIYRESLRAAIMAAGENDKNRHDAFINLVDYTMLLVEASWPTPCQISSQLLNFSSPFCRVVASW